MEFLHKIEEKPFKDFYWNIPEQKQNVVNIIGGNSQNFRTPVKITEYLTNNFPIKTVNLVLPNALQSSLPPLDNLIFLASTDSGSFKDAAELTTTINSADYSLLIGDLSKNSITRKAVYTACLNSEKPIIITRDAIDLITEEANEQLLTNENLVLLTSIAQLQKLFHAVYYPKMLLMSSPLTQIIEALHKFTLSYKVQIITLHNGQILVAKNGEIYQIPLEKTSYTPLNIWFGELAAKILAINIFNPGKSLESAVAAFFEANKTI